MTMTSVTPASPVFVIGCPRSGTSALSWAIAQHPAFWTSAESDFLLHLCGQGRLRKAYQTAYERPDQGWLYKNSVAYEEFAAFVGLGFDRLFLSRSGGKRWVDSTPGHTLMAQDLALMFPQGKFLHIVRDGRAVTNSMIHSGFDTPWARDFRAACETWVGFVRAGCQFQASHPDRCLEVRQERLIASTEAEVARVCQHLEVEHDPAMVAFLREQRINSSYGNLQKEDIRMPKSPSMMPERPWEQWSKGMLKTFQALAGSTMIQLGYFEEMP